MIIIEIILRIIGYVVIFVGGYVLLGALSLWCSVFAEEKICFKKCLKYAWINTLRGRAWYDKIDE